MGGFENIERFWLRKHGGLKFFLDLVNQGFVNDMLLKFRLELRVNSFSVL